MRFTPVLPLVLRVLSIGSFALADWHFVASKSATAQNNPALFGPSVNAMIGPQRTMPLGPFGPYDLFSVYVSPGLYARQPLGHEIIRTGPNGYIYRPIFEPQQPTLPPVAAPPGSFATGTTPLAIPQSAISPAAAPSANETFTPQMRELFLAAENAFRAGRYDEALNKIQNLLDANPKLGLAALLHAETLFALGKYPESAAAMRWAMSNLPRQQWGIIVENHRKFYADPRKFQEQLQALENYVQQNPTNPSGRFLLGYHYGYAGRRIEGAGQLSAALELFQLDEQARLLQEQFRDPNAPAARPGIQVAPGPANPIPAPRGPQEF